EGPGRVPGPRAVRAGVGGPPVDRQLAAAVLVRRAGRDLDLDPAAGRELQRYLDHELLDLPAAGLVPGPGRHLRPRGPPRPAPPPPPRGPPAPAAPATDAPPVTTPPPGAGSPPAAPSGGCPAADRPSPAGSAAAGAPSQYRCRRNA